MAKQIDLEIKESKETLQSLLSKQKSISNRSRVKMLLLIQEKKVVYTKDLVSKLKYCRKSIYNWIELYRNGGLEQLLASTKGGNNTPVIQPHTKLALQEKLSDPSTTITSYVELLEWVHKNCQSNICYGTLYSYCRKHHQSVLKVPRKSHHKKEEQAIEALKKTPNSATRH